MKKVIRLTENELHRIVKESVIRVLKESSPYDNDGSIYDGIDSKLSQIGDAYVSKFYSDEHQITIAAHRNIGRDGRNEIIDMMKNLGYEYYTAGANDEYVMMTFKPL